VGFFFDKNLNVMDDNMIKSGCCKENVYYFDANDGLMCYMCYRCDNECDIISLIEHDERISHDARGKTETQGVTDSA
jgi:hypothetical protein